MKNLLVSVHLPGLPHPFKSRRFVKNPSLASVAAVLLFALVPLSIRAAEQFWDPNGATVGTSISGNWDTVTSNWTAAADSGINKVWAQVDNANFDVAANYTVTLTEPIIIGNLTVTGSS